MNVIFLKTVAVCLLPLAIESCAPKALWTEEEAALIDAHDSLMRVLTVEDASDSIILRRKCAVLGRECLESASYEVLAQKMISTVVDAGGVGIAGPQVGISRRVVAVQRFDKAGEPFEVYPDIRIVAGRGDCEPGPEGCLSIPGRRETILRWRDIDIAYTSPKTRTDTLETVQGFTAVIFQHECDHLDGILYPDRLN